MNIKPIQFPTEMAKAVREGRKTQQRYPVRQPPLFGDILKDEMGWYYEDGTRNGHTLNPPYQPGETLWIREPWLYIKESDDDGFYIYAADHVHPEVFKWRRSAKMPRAAARSFLRVKDVRVERLHEMNEAAAIAEGFPASPAGTDSPLERFTSAWDRTIRRDDLRNFGYHANPWVWVIEFEQSDMPEGWCE